ncbi:uncharacterized protein LY79DRAFT_583623 [Colletotrichum navitas]|uniref:Secreted protein n=1 Tax=Colletotrichum navitas TaxID=681940 RepID=A0AAD8PNP8_9PEZI|nr:uncharacterized protein LY79DRAFT_583623 [Colletotrichum navitas]KAK1573502.1 hypothetical protein LY79DRAFT_583623 [Colletotrichum navitas]
MCACTCVCVCVCVCVCLCLCGNGGGGEDAQGSCHSPRQSLDGGAVVTPPLFGPPYSCLCYPVTALTPPPPLLLAPPPGAATRPHGVISPLVSLRLQTLLYCRRSSSKRCKASSSSPSYLS